MSGWRIWGTERKASLVLDREGERLGVTAVRYSEGTGYSVAMLELDLDGICALQSKLAEWYPGARPPVWMAGNAPWCPFFSREEAEKAAAACQFPTEIVCIHPDGRREVFHP